MLPDDIIKSRRTLPTVAVWKKAEKAKVPFDLDRKDPGSSLESVRVEGLVYV